MTDVNAREIAKTQIMVDFETGIYKEYLEEASFLYEQRFGLLDDPEITWLHIDGFEERFEPYIDGLVVGEDLALEVCKTQAVEGDFGELHAAVRVFCRQKRLDLLLEVLEALEPDDVERLQAISDALNHEMPIDWQNEFIRRLSEGDQKIVYIVAQFIGYRRLGTGTTLLRLLQQDNTNSLSKIIWAIGRIREQNARNLLLEYLQHEDEAVCSAAALALLRIGDQQAVDECLRYAGSQNWAFLPIGLGSNHSAVPVLLRIANNRMTADCLIALGLLGDISAIDTLLAYLADEKLAESSAIALNLITGAELYEEAFIPEEIDEDELFDDELEALENGESLTPEGEEPSGTTITRLSQKPEEWQKWWTENKSRFNSRMRYRNGKLYSPACLLENLEFEKSRCKIRKLAYEEFVIRYGVDFPFETDMLVSQQKQVLAKYAEWVQTNRSRFREGQWYFAGQLI